MTKSNIAKNSENPKNSVDLGEDESAEGDENGNENDKGTNDADDDDLAGEVILFSPNAARANEPHNTEVQEKAQSSNTVGKPATNHENDDLNYEDNPLFRPTKSKAPAKNTPPPQQAQWNPPVSAYTPSNGTRAPFPAATLPNQNDKNGFSGFRTSTDYHFPFSSESDSSRNSSGTGTGTTQPKSGFASSIWSDNSTSSFFPSMWDGNNPKIQVPEPMKGGSTFGSGRMGGEAGWSSAFEADDFPEKGGDAIEKLLPGLSDDGDDAPPGFRPAGPTTSTNQAVNGRSAYPPPPSVSGNGR